jgi:cytochrome P450
MTERQDHRVDLDPFDPGFIASPFPEYHALQAAGGACYMDRGKGFWLISRHELVRQVVGDPAQFSSESGPLGATLASPELRARLAEVAPNGRAGDVPTLLTLDPPGHTRNRRLISRAFTPASVRRYEDFARGVCRSIIAGWVDGESIDFVAQFAVPLPVRVVACGLDVPDDRVEDFKRWSDASVAAIGSDLTDDEIVEDLTEVLEMESFIAEQIERKRRDGPAPDVMSSLVHARLSDDEAADFDADTRRALSDQEIQSIVRQLLVAGNETTTNLLTQMMIFFHDSPEWWQCMRQDPDLIPLVVEESLRMASPSAVNQRVARCPVHVGGATIPGGDVVLVGYLAADHDPDVFPDPERFDPHRTNLSDHLAFGRGVHFCPGASLARMEARVALEELTRAVDQYELPERGELAWNKSFQLRAVKTLSYRPRLQRSAGADQAEESGR